MDKRSKVNGAVGRMGVESKQLGRLREVFNENGGFRNTETDCKQR